MRSIASSLRTPNALPPMALARVREGTAGRLKNPARSTYPCTSTLRISHFPDPRTRRYARHRQPGRGHSKPPVDNRREPVRLRSPTRMPAASSSCDFFSLSHFIDAGWRRRCVASANCVGRGCHRLVLRAAPSQADLVDSECGLFDGELGAVRTRQLVDESLAGERRVVEIVLGSLDSLLLPVHLQLADRPSGVRNLKARAILRGQLVDEALSTES